MTTTANTHTPQLPILYWEDVQEGMEETSPARTITEADLTAFAAVSGDYNQIHTDVMFCAENGLGNERLVHGLLGTAITSGLYNRTALGIGLQAQLIAMLSCDVTFTAPLRIGDTVHVQTRVAGGRPTSDPARGILEFHRKLVNQDGTISQETVVKQLFRRRPISATRDEQRPA